MNILTEKHSKPRRRPYQSEAIVSLLDSVKNYLDWILENPEQKYENSALLEMATGSWKTYTIWNFLNLVLHLRNRQNRGKENPDFEWLNILILTNRIDWLNQFRDDFVHGRPENGKSPIISPDLLKNSTISTFHSQADNLDDIDEKYFTQDESIETENFTPQNSRKKDNFFFSTYQTANVKEIESKIPYFDIIIIDEAHNVKKWNEFESLIDRLAVHGRDEKEPLIIPITATPTNLTLDLFWEPIFSYVLAEYLASDYSPSVKYKLVTSSKASKEDLESMTRMVEDAKSIKDHKEKKELIKQIEEKFNQVMLKMPNLQELVSDVLTRLYVADDEIKETIIFSSSIGEADAIVKEINKENGSQIATAFHSKWERNALNRLKDPNDTTKIVVAVDMLNESIDLPVVSNIVFWRWTDTARIYLQQFGRWLRGDWLVRYYDYVWSMKNFSWIGQIYEDFKEVVRRTWWNWDHSNWNDISDRMKHFQLLWGNTWIQEYSFDLSQIWFDILDLKESLELKTLEDYKKYFEENIEEFKNFGCDFSTDESGNKRVDLNKIWRPQKFDLFWQWAISWLRNLNKALWNPDEEEVKSIPKAQKILKEFFEKLWYIVSVDIKEKIKELKTLDDYKRYFEENIEEFDDFWCVFVVDKNENEMVDLSDIWNPNRLKLFWIWSKSWLRNVNKALWNTDEGEVINKTKAQKILKEFFEKLWYIVILDINKLKTLDDYKRYFEENIEEFDDFWCVFVADKNENEMVDLSDIWNPNRLKLFWIWAGSWLRNLNKLLWNTDAGIVQVIPKTQKILKEFFESLWYMVIVDINEFKTLDDYKKYFEENQKEFESFGCIFNEGKSWNKRVDINKIQRPREFDLFWKNVRSWLRNVNIALWNTDEGEVDSIPKAQKVLKEFFESLWYMVFLDIKEKIKELKTLDDYKKYFEENIEEFRTFGCDFSEDENWNKRIDVNKIRRPPKFDLFWKKAPTWLRNLNKVLWNTDAGIVQVIPKAQKILKEFFESLWYIVE